MIPTSATLTSRSIMDVITPGSHGSTFGGNPLACAVGQAVLDLMEEEPIADHAAAVGQHFLDLLQGIQSDYIKEVRGKGLLLAVEFDPRFGSARSLAEDLLREGILSKDTHDQTLRF